MEVGWRWVKKKILHLYFRFLASWRWHSNFRFRSTSSSELGFFLQVLVADDRKHVAVRARGPHRVAQLRHSRPFSDSTEPRLSSTESERPLLNRELRSVQCGRWGGGGSAGKALIVLAASWTTSRFHPCPKNNHPRRSTHVFDPLCHFWPRWANSVVCLRPPGEKAIAARIRQGLITTEIKLELPGFVAFCKQAAPATVGSEGHELRTRV